MCSPVGIKRNSYKKVWWRCKKGHEWEAQISARTREGKETGCPYCANKKILPGYNDLNSQNMILAGEWHPTKNDDLTPYMVSVSSSKKVWWLGKCGHEWVASISNRNKGNGCPYCANQIVLKGYNDLATIEPAYAEEWNFEKNGELTPNEVFPYSTQKVWWLGKCGHEWQSSISNRTRMGSGCPICSHRVLKVGFNDLLTLAPEIAEEWHPQKNGSLLPQNILIGSSKEVWWLGKCGHEWKSKIRYRTRSKNGCPYCANQRLLKGFNDLQSVNPELAKEWHPTKNKNLKPDEVFSSASKEVWWVCYKGHEWKKAIRERSTGSGCPFCAKENKSSFPEQVLFFYFKSKFSDAINGYRDSCCAPLSLTFA